MVVIVMWMMSVMSEILEIYAYTNCPSNIKDVYLFYHSKQAVLQIMHLRVCSIIFRGFKKLDRAYEEAKAADDVIYAHV